jgi:hypothetical protein
MNRPSTAREALIVEALGEVASLLDRIESLTRSMEAGRLALANASAEFDNRLKDFQGATTAITQQVQARAIDHIVRRTGKATTDSMEAQVRAMSSAARLAFSTQVDSTLARLNQSLHEALHRVDRPWGLWLTHAATAAVSAALTSWVVSSFAVC